MERSKAIHQIESPARNIAYIEVRQQVAKEFVHTTFCFSSQTPKERYKQLQNLRFAIWQETRSLERQMKKAGS